MHTPVEFYLKIPVDLFRGGTPTNPKFDYLRTSPPRTEDQVYDVKIDPKTDKIKSKSGGLSLFNKPNYSFGQNWWVVPKDTPLPPGFTITKDCTNGKFKGHYSIRSMNDIHVSQWKKVLKEWAAEHAVHIKDYQLKDVK